MLARRGLLRALCTPLILRAPEFGKIIMLPKRRVVTEYDTTQTDIIFNETVRADIEAIAKQLNRAGMEKAAWFLRDIIQVP